MAHTFVSEVSLHSWLIWPTVRQSGYSFTLPLVGGTENRGSPSYADFAEGLKAFPFLSQGIFGKKPFPEFLKTFPDLESD